MVGDIGQGLLVLLGVEKADTPLLIDKMIHRILSYRVFADAEGKMNDSVSDVGGSLLVVSQFTLAADTQKGLRPSFSSAASPDTAKHLYELFVARLKEQAAKTKVSGMTGVSVATGVFGADMKVALINDGPVTFLLDVN